MEIIDCIQRPSSYSLWPSSFSVRRIKNSILRFKAVTADRRKSLASLKKYWWAPVLLICLIEIPQIVWGFIRSWEATARNISLEGAFYGDVALADQAMSDFASNQVALFDSEGNLLSDTGLPLRSEMSLRTKVTFKNYTVRGGETVSSITKKFGLNNMSTIIAVNSISNVRSLKAGQKLLIPSIDGLYHTVLKGESISSVAKKYSVTQNDLLDVNDLASEVIAPGSKLFIPGARLAANDLKKAMGELFMKPITASYRITDVFGPRIDPIAHVRKNHTGIDIACPEGTAIHPAMSGKVSKTGWSSVFGNYVLVEHIDGYQSLYAHMSKITCKKGDRVEHSSVIGKVGSTGYSTGNHLHFTVYKNGKLINPESVVKLR